MIGGSSMVLRLEHQSLPRLAFDVENQKETT
jgi:hypothetical protein